MSFKKDKYLIVKKALSKELTDFIYKYFLLKREVAKTFFETRFISPCTEEFGIWTDQQVPNTYSHYADICMETLLVKLLPLTQIATELELTPNYSYARIYKKGDILHKHKDRFSCEISTTLNLGGDSWPIFIKDMKNKTIKINLKPGDLLIYRGEELEHWREPLEGEHCSQVFLHYNDKKTVNSDKNIFDTRPHLGLPAYFKNEK
jgi:hypothetical protein